VGAVAAARAVRPPAGPYGATLAAVDREDAVGRDAAALEAFVDETIRLARKHGYHPTEFLRMRSRYGTVGAISRLVRSGDIQPRARRVDDRSGGRPIPG